MMEIEEKCLLVTGATGGIGSVLCKLLAKEGARLVLTGFDAKLLRSLQLELGAPHTSVAADISSAEGREKIIEACEQVGGIDGVINLAGILDFKMFENQSPDIIEAIFSINMLAPVLLCRQLLTSLKEKPEAVILNVGSIFGSIGHPGFTAYCASKAGLKSFTESLARELADTTVQVSYIAPRATKTELNSSKIDELNEKLGNKTDSAEYVAGQIIGLFKSGKRLRYLGWPEKLFVRVNALFPSIVHKALVKNLKIIKHYAI